nr:IS66 family transposase [Escherichia coli]
MPSDKQESSLQARARRKIHDVNVRHSTTVTAEALNRIGELYAIESESRSNPAQEQLLVRKTRNVPLMQSLHDWIQ